MMTVLHSYLLTTRYSLLESAKMTVAMETPNTTSGLVLFSCSSTVNLSVDSRIESWSTVMLTQHLGSESESKQLVSLIMV